MQRGVAPGFASNTDAPCDQDARPARLQSCIVPDAATRARIRTQIRHRFLTSRIGTIGAQPSRAACAWPRMPLLRSPSRPPRTESAAPARRAAHRRLRRAVPAEAVDRL
ncbi:hypothetical protein WS70_06335 [Burkholderia mayonis]|uniref:Uncharacterized protein n=1 Tax=Burkholderia mayonis TaxID=1385591 RepID=A0A1B4FCS1_9BURK|nr:hypothetical protein WS70_06335 [Burkholderia mayonis]KVE48838.1 hypothetical protein WS70_00845 [Burkholderia mayonis]